MPSSRSKTSRRSAALTVGLALGICTCSTPSSRALLVHPGWSSLQASSGSSARRGWVRPRPGCSSSCTCEHRPRMSTSRANDVENGENSRVVDPDLVRLVLGQQKRGDRRVRSARDMSTSDNPGPMDSFKRAGIGMLSGLVMAAGVMGGGGSTAFADVSSGTEVASTIVAPTSSVTVQDLQRYDGFEDYAAQGQQMENSDVGCFANECKRETASCFTDGSCLKGVTCLGRCKGEQECATRCFAQYGSERLDSWLTCTLEDHSCVKIPKDMDFSAIDRDPPHIVKGFDPRQLQGTWYKVMGVNKKYDCFDCQKNTFSVAKVADGAGEEGGSDQVADIKVNFRLAKPDSDDFWENTITERLQVDPSGSPRTFHTNGKLFGLTFKENWYVTGQSTDPGQEFVFVQYKGHTLQGSYDGGFVYARKPYLPSAALIKVAKVAREHGIDPDGMIPIDNTCSLRPSLPRAGDTTKMNVLERVKYEMSFVYDLMEWVHPGTIHKYASADQKKLQASSRQVPDSGRTTMSNVAGVSSSLQAGPRSPLEGLSGDES